MTWQAQTVEPEGHVDCRTYGLPLKWIDKVHIGDRLMTYDEFFAMVEYVLENTDLYKDDPRLAFMEKIRTSTIVDGWECVFTKKPCIPKRIELGKE